MGLNTSKPQINHECPICYISSDKTDDGIILNCGHYYNKFCIQRHCIKSAYHLQKSKCPLCNQIISNKYIKLIYKDIILLTSDPCEWYRRDIIRLGNKTNFYNIRLKYRKFNDNQTQIISPLIKNGSLYLPIYFYSQELQ